MRCATGALIVALLGPAATAQSIVLEATVPPGGIAFGEAFELVVVRTWPSGDADPFDERALAPLSVEVLGTEPAPAAGTLATPAGDRLRYRARCFASGDVTIGPIMLRCRDGERIMTAKSAPVQLRVRSSLPEPAGGFEWPGDVRELPSSQRWPWLVAAAALLLGGLFWWRRPRAVARVAAAIVQPPEPTALRELRALRVPGDNADPAAVIAFHAAVKRLVRQHCRERFAVAAEVCTSEELQRMLAAGEQLAACLRACDLVLFAAVLPHAAQRGHALAAAIAFAAEGTP